MPAKLTGVLAGESHWTRGQGHLTFFQYSSPTIWNRNVSCPGGFVSLYSVWKASGPEKDFASGLRYFGCNIFSWPSHCLSDTVWVDINPAN